MKRILLSVGFWLLISRAAIGQLDTAKLSPKIVHISTGVTASTPHKPDSSNFQAIDLPGTAGIFILSLVDKDRKLIDNWDDFVASCRYPNCLIVVCEDDEASKSEFVLCFYQQRLQGIDIEEAYHRCRENFRARKDLYTHLKRTKE